LTKGRSHVNSISGVLWRSRYSFGCPACPNLADRKQLPALLKAEEIGVTLSEEDRLEPEQSTSAIVVHHPQAKYFSV
jgi:5-methyltetrahydrofolate--homocysteine methyltransferase